MYFNLLSRTAHETKKNYTTRAMNTRDEWEAQHETYKEESVAGGVMLTARNHDRLYISLRDFG